MALSVAPSALAARAAAAYLGVALGDALGATVEFMTPREIAHDFGVHREIVGGGWLKLRVGQVTDDTTMSLALGAAILARRGEVDAFACAQALDAWMRAKPVDIGNTVRRNLLQFRRSGNPVAPPSEHDAGNGAAMRVLPVALATLGLAEERVCAAVRAQAHITHHNAASDAACEFLALTVQDLLRGATLASPVVAERLRALVADFPAFAFRDKPRRENPSGWIVETMQAVLQALTAAEDGEQCLIDIVNRGGDADTTGAIAGMLCGALYANWPERWLKALDTGVRDACVRQAHALLPLPSGYSG